MKTSKKEATEPQEGGSDKSWDWRRDQEMAPGGRKGREDMAESSFIPERFRNNGSEIHHKSWENKVFQQRPLMSVQNFVHGTITI